MVYVEGKYKIIREQRVDMGKLKCTVIRFLYYLYSWILFEDRLG